MVILRRTANGSICPMERSQWEVVVLEEMPMGGGERNQWEGVVLGRGANEKWLFWEEKPMESGHPGSGEPYGDCLTPSLNFSHKISLGRTPKVYRRQLHSG